jgi:hypothetical protein
MDDVEREYSSIPCLLEVEVEGMGEKAFNIDDYNPTWIVVPPW